MVFNFLKKNIKKYFLVLDIGSEAVKAAVCESSIGDTTSILGVGLKYFDRYSTFNGWDFESEILKRAISESVESALRESLKNGKERPKKFPVLITLPADILKAKIVSESLERADYKSKISESEEKNIENDIMGRARKKVATEFSEKSGIMPIDLEWVDFKIIGEKIDGYPVSKINGFKGKLLEFKVLAVFLPKLYFSNFKKIFKSLRFNDIKIIHLAEAIQNALEFESEGFVFDLGGKITQFFSIKKGELDQIADCMVGGEEFSNKIEEFFGLSDDSARILKERYAGSLLSLEAEKKIRDILSREKNVFLENMEKEFFKYFKKRPNSLRGVVFGGGSLLPEIQEYFKIGQEDACPPQILKSFSYKDLTNKMSNPQFIPVSLLCDYGKKVF